MRRALSRVVGGGGRGRKENTHPPNAADFIRPRRKRKFLTFDIRVAIGSAVCTPPSLPLGFP